MMLVSCHWDAPCISQEAPEQLTTPYLACPAGSAAAALSDGSQRAQVQEGATKAQLRSTASMGHELPAGES